MDHPFTFSKWAKSLKKQLTEDSPSVIETLLEQLKQEAQTFYFRGSILTARKQLNLEQLVKNDTVKHETLLEILLTSGHEHFYNQFAFGPGTSKGSNRRIAADMIELEADNRTIKSIIELKTNEQGSSGDFYWACYEVIYYYFLLRHADNKNTNQAPAVIFRQRYLLKEPLQLVVLAPGSFYDKKAARFIEIINVILRKEKAFISFSSIHSNYLNDDTFQEIKKAVQDYEKWKRIICRHQPQDKEA